jgi:ribulose 1,5-bisphosphate synthetase/thiazole synthase
MNTQYPQPEVHPNLFYYRPPAPFPSRPVITADVCVYGATAAGVVAAVALRKRGRSVVIINPSRFVGGMTSGGLSFTDTGVQTVIGGLSREFYRECGSHYG